MSDSPEAALFEQMSRHLSRVSEELFMAYGFDVQARLGCCGTTSEADATQVAAIGYVGEQVRGALTLAATDDSIAIWQRRLMVDTEPCDTLGEFANMLLGRLKARLFSDGFPIVLATPTTVAGRGLRLSARPGLGAWVLVEGAGFCVSVRLDARFEPGFVLRSGDASASVAQAGDSILF
jgi:CheY-specific phosphatase CheX